MSKNSLARHPARRLGGAPAHVRGAIIKIQWLIDEALLLCRLPKVVELLRRLIEGGFRCTREVDAAEQDGSTVGIAEVGCVCVDVVGWHGVACDVGGRGGCGHDGEMEGGCVWWTVSLAK